MLSGRSLSLWHSRIIGWHSKTEKGGKYLLPPLFGKSIFHRVGPRIASCNFFESGLIFFHRIQVIRTPVTPASFPKKLPSYVPQGIIYECWTCADACVECCVNIDLEKIPCFLVQPPTENLWRRNRTFHQVLQAILLSFCNIALIRM